MYRQSSRWSWNAWKRNTSYRPKRAWRRTVAWGQLVNNTNFGGDSAAGVSDTRWWTGLRVLRQIRSPERAWILQSSPFLVLGPRPLLFQLFQWFSVCTGGRWWPSREGEVKSCFCRNLTQNIIQRNNVSLLIKFAVVFVFFLIFVEDCSPLINEEMTYLCALKFSIIKLANNFKFYPISFWFLLFKIFLLIEC